TVEFREWWGKEKRSNILASLTGNVGNPYGSLIPDLVLGLPFEPFSVSVGYERWPQLPEIFPVSFPGIQSSRDEVVIDIDRDRLLSRMSKYFDAAVSNEELLRIAPTALKDTGRFDATKTREYLTQRGFLPNNIF